MSEDILAQRLREGGFGHLIKTTEIISDLADQEKEVIVVIMAVELALDDYNTGPQERMTMKMMKKQKIQLIEAILEGNSEAIQEAYDFLKEIEKG